MSKYYASVKWERSGQNFLDNKYSRAHFWHFDGGLKIPASSSPHVVPLPMSDENNLDPEEAFVASISSCHMLFFLSIAAKNKFLIDSYTDNVTGIMEKDSSGILSITKVLLKPEIIFAGEKIPSSEKIKEMHHQSHKLCFIANSVKSEIMIE